MLQLGARFIFRPSRILYHDGRARSFGGGRARSGYSFFDKPRAGVANRTARQPHEQRIHINGPDGFESCDIRRRSINQISLADTGFCSRAVLREMPQASSRFSRMGVVPFAVDGANTLLHPESACGRQDMAETCDRTSRGHPGSACRPEPAKLTRTRQLPRIEPADAVFALPFGPSEKTS